MKRADKKEIAKGTYNESLRSRFKTHQISDAEDKRTPHEPVEKAGVVLNRADHGARPVISRQESKQTLYHRILKKEQIRKRNKRMDQIRSNTMKKPIT
ncbi:hypothetical protein SUGI_0415030 [Cryptomeria japonica]|nr:hypothetical protein SUGI_0415030 [Cryptomeria japonica]